MTFTRNSGARDPGGRNKILPEHYGDVNDDARLAAAPSRAQIPSLSERLHFSLKVRTKASAISKSSVPFTEASRGISKRIAAFTT